MFAQLILYKLNMQVPCECVYIYIYIVQFNGDSNSVKSS